MDIVKYYIGQKDKKGNKIFIDSTVYILDNFLHKNKKGKVIWDDKNKRIYVSADEGYTIYLFPIDSDRLEVIE